jgi:hypothetical protein
VKRGQNIVGNVEQFSRGICTDVMTDSNSFHIQVEIFLPDFAASFGD